MPPSTSRNSDTFYEHLPKVVGNFGYVFEKELPVNTYYQFMPEHLPREFMDEIQSVKGDSGARVAFTADFGMKEFGNGASGSCTLSISCGGDATNIARAVDIVSRWSIYYAKQHYERAEAEFRQMAVQRGKAV